MKKFIDRVLKFITVLLSIAFVIATVAALFLYNIEQTAFTPDLYKQALQDEQIYDRLPSVIGDQLVTSLGFQVCADNPIACGVENRSPELEACLTDTLGAEAYQALALDERAPTEAERQRAVPCFDQYGYPAAQGEESDLAPYMRNLTAKDWELLITGLIPPDDLQHITETALDETFAYLNGAQDTAKIPLESVKRRLNGEEGVQAVLQFLKAQPPCTPSEIAAVQNLASGGDLVYCNPPADMLPLLEPTLKSELHSVAVRIPQEVVIGKHITPQGLKRLQSMRLLMRMSPLIAIGLLLLITILAVRSPKSWLRWWGIPLLIAGILGLFAGMATIPLLDFAANRIIDTQISPLFSNGLVSLLYDLIFSVLQGLRETIVLHALVIALFGLVMTLASFFAKLPHEDPNNA